MSRDPKRSEHDGKGICGTLFVVAMPIGNLEDITLRGLQTLKSAPVIAAENISHTRNLCRHYDFGGRLVSYNQHNRTARGPELIEMLKSGLDVALVTDAGTPGISDPGNFLIRLAAEEHVKVSPIPGPSAVIAALSVSGLPAEKFAFLGFLSNKSGKRKKELKSLASETRTLVFFEAPHRLKAMLADIREIFGNREMALLREMTKVFEEVVRGTAGEILERISEQSVRGEVTLVVAGRKEAPEADEIPEEVLERIDELLKEDRLSLRDIASQISMEEGSAFRLIYKECLARKKVIDGSNAPDH